MIEKTNILLVDDRDDNLLVLESILSPLGQNLVKATSGQEALKYIFNLDISVVLLDVTMPGMNGFETATLIRERDKSRHIPIIFVTGHSIQEASIMKGYALGGLDYILKPIVPEILRAKINVFVDLHQKTAEINKQTELLRQSNIDLKHEIIERRRIEKKLWELNKSLEMRVRERTAAAKQHAHELSQSNEELEQFANIVAHDLQEPIRKIVNFTQAFQEIIPKGLNNQQKKYLSYIVDGAMRMKDLIQDLLRFSQVGRSELPMKQVNVGAILKKVLTEIEPVIDESFAKVKVSPLPTITANQTMIHQLFQNLILNAIKFRSRKSPLIQISSKIENGSNIFSVQDNGIGIEPQYWDKIFKIFQRLHTRDEYPGSGIGLSICKKIVERQGGCIWINSELGKGSTFSFSIPITVRKEEKHGARSVEENQRTLETTLDS